MNKKAYLVVHREDYQGDTVYGVYSTKGKALRAIVSLNEGESYPTDYLILEMPVDAKPDYNNYKTLDQA
jgi:hypothetical protein